MKTGLRQKFVAKGAILASACCLLGSGKSSDSLPTGLEGTWRIVRILPTTNISCWSHEQGQQLIGSRLAYHETSMRWQGGEVPLQGVTTRSVTAAEFSKENTGATKSASFNQLGIHSQRVLEVDMQHDDADITGSTTEVPGDSVLIVSPNHIVVSACGLYYEAAREKSGTLRGETRK